MSDHYRADPACGRVACRQGQAVLRVMAERDALAEQVLLLRLVASDGLAALAQVKRQSAPTILSTEWEL